MSGEAIELEKDNPVDAIMAVGRCPYGYICFYDTSTSSTWMEADPDSFTAFRCYNLLSSSNNKTSYIVNWTYARWRVYDSANCNSTAGYIHPNSSGPMNSAWTNKISSFMREPIP
ncbi:MAG TPA: hypothetical protein VK550_22640 [Polyangiaceae bacterium]|nr:hypothetical protein [Polyangiaceae bacterium]